MGKTLDLGERIELCSIDAHFKEISLGLYCRTVDGKQQLTVHSYSQHEGTSERADFILTALKTSAGLVEVPGQSKWLQFDCSMFHKRAIKRSFLDLCKLASDAPLSVKPLTAFDKKAKCDLSVEGLGNGLYRTKSAEDTESGRKRAKALAVGFAKVCEMELDEEQQLVAFRCKCSHDALMGLMFFRAQNVRAAMREEEAAASRGVLAPPSQQE